MISSRTFPLVLLVASLLLSMEVSGRVGSSSSSSSSSSSTRRSDADAVGGRSSGRNLGGGYGTPGKHHGSTYKSKHQGHYDYYYVRPIEPPDHYVKLTDPTKEPSQHSMPVEGKTDTNEPVASPTFRPTQKVTEEIPRPTAEPTTEKVPALPTVPPVSSSVVDIEIVDDIETIITSNISDITNITNDEPEEQQQTTINFVQPSQIQLRIQDFVLNGGVEFEDPSSYQSAALRRVEEQVGAEDMSDVKLMQYYSLYSIFEATNSKTNDFIIQSRAFANEDDAEPKIPGWKISSGWLENDVDPCVGEWYGVSCVNDQIVTLDLFDNGMTGNFAPEVVLLAGDGFYATGAGALVSLDIFNNEFMSNNGDNSWIQDLGSQLGYLYIQNTVFSGALPPNLPSGLVELDIANSMISGGLQGSTFEKLTSLRFLLMDGVQFDSTIPSEIAQLPNLEYLFATDAMITGDLSYMESMSVIFEHWVDRNPGLGGTIPSFVGNLTTLQSFSISECSFTGTIPESLGSLSLMQQMWLYGNQLTGEIPASMGDLKFLRIFEVEDNNLSDNMPQSVCDNFSIGMLQVLGADCDRLECPCCTCCSVEECREQS